MFVKDTQSTSLAVSKSQTLTDLSIDAVIIHLESCEKHVSVIAFEAMFVNFLVFFNVFKSYTTKDISDSSIQF